MTDPFLDGFIDEFVSPQLITGSACINGANFLLNWVFSSLTSSKAQKMLFKNLILAALAGGAVVLGQNVADAKVTSSNSYIDLLI